MGICEVDLSSTTYDTSSLDWYDFRGLGQLS